jgi:hypothetical protein
MRPGGRHLRIWLLACMWCLLVWTASAKASWEAYQQAGEEAYSRGDYSTARRMFLAAVREARYFGLQDPRLDISLNKLALLRAIRGQHSGSGGRAQHVVRKKHRTRKHSAVRRGRQRQASRMVLRRARPGRQHHALLPTRPGEHRRGTRTSIARQIHRTKRPRTVLHHARPTRHAAPLVHRGKRHGVIRTPRLHRGHTRQRPPTTLHGARPQRPGHTPRAVHPDRRRKGARSGRRAMLLAPYATPALSTSALPPWLATDLVT